MTQHEILNLLSELIKCHSPSGDEQEIEIPIWREFEATGAKVWQDASTNLYAQLPGTGVKVMVCAHKDEIGMVLTEVRPDGRLSVQNVGGSYPWKYGEGPVDILGDDGQVVRAVLSVGSVHTQTGPVAELVNKKPLKWEHISLFTGLTPDQLAAKGVHIGSRAVVAKERKQIQHLGDYVASFALDDRMGLVSMILAARELALESLPLDLYFVATTSEEVGLIGAARAAQRLQPDICIALDTSPVAHGTPLVVDARPVIWYKEAVYHNKTDCDLLLKIANELGFGAQPVIYNGASSDAAVIKRSGLAGRTAAFGFARDNSHGFEIAHVNAIPNVTRLLVEYLKRL